MSGAGPIRHSASWGRLAAIFVTLLVLLSPFLWLVLMSFKTNAEIFRFPPRLFFDATLANYAALWTSEFRSSFEAQPQ